MENNLATFLVFVGGAWLFMIVTTLYIRVRGWQPTLRPIDGYTEMPRQVSASLETARSLHFSIGASGIGDQSTLTTLASLALIYELVEKQAFSNQLPTVSLSDPISLAIAQDTLRKAYAHRQNELNYNPTLAAWYPQTKYSLAFGAGASGLATDEKAGAQFLFGEFGTELAYFGEASVRHDQYMVGHSTKLEGQAIAYAQSNALLIGEELFVGLAYTNTTKPFANAGVLALDILRWIAILSVIIIALSKA